jgi:hypothetical protein
VKDLERYIDLYTKAYDDHLPVLDQLEETQQKYDELVQEIERIEMSLVCFLSCFFTFSIFLTLIFSYRERAKIMQSP